MLDATLNASNDLVPGIGSNPDFFRTGFALTEQERFGLSAYQGKNYLLRLDSRGVPEREDEASLKQELRIRLKSEWERYFLEKEYERLKSLVEIEVVSPQYIDNV